MYNKKIRNKALQLYLSNIPIYKIAKQLDISKQPIMAWRKKYKWVEIREETLQKEVQKITDKMINEQTLIGAIATAELLERLKNGEIRKLDDLIKLLKHGLEVVRPKQVTNNLNITKNDNVTQIKVNIPDEVIELVNGSGLQSNSETRTSISETDR